MSTTAIGASLEQRRSNSMKRRESICHAMPYILPHFIIFAIFGIIPIVFGIYLAFTKWNMIGDPQFIGLGNFARIFDPDSYFFSLFWRDLWHTLIFVVISVPLTIIIPLLLAVGLEKKGLKGGALSRTAERAVLLAVGAYDVVMAAITVFMYAGWFRGESYAVLESRGLLREGAESVSSVIYVAQIYGFVVAAVGVVPIVIALRGMRAATVSRGVMAYLGACMVFSLLTADLLGVVGYSLCLAVYCARNKAIRLAAGRPA